MAKDVISVAEQFVQVLDDVVEAVHRPAALHEPEFVGREWEYVKDCLDSGWVSSVGEYVEEFERQLAEMTGARHAVAVVNGTAALHVSLVAIGVQPGDEVLIPALTFVATANAVSHCGAIPHLIDSDPDSLGMSASVLKAHLDDIALMQDGRVRNRLTGRPIVAIVPMHVFGHGCDMPALIEIAEAWSLPIIEDAAEALGATLYGRHLGTWGSAGVLSFNGNKLATTGGGGAILTDSDVIATRLKHLTTTAKVPHRWEFIHDEVAFNYRMPNLNAALGCAQLERVQDMVLRKRELAFAYEEAVRKQPGLKFVREPSGCRSNYWLNAIRLANKPEALNDVLLMVNAAGYQCRPLWRPMHRLDMYSSCPRSDVCVADSLASSIINVPSSPKLVGGRS